MPPRASVFQKAQLGVETVKGTSVAANKRLLSTGINITPRTPLDDFRAVGDKAPSGVSAQKEWSEGTIRGVLSYSDIVYLLSSVLKKAAVPGTWLFKPDNFNPNDLVTYTIECGSSGGAEKFVFGIVTGLEFRFRQAEASITGSIIGRQMTEAVMITPTPTEIPEKNVDAKTVDILVADTVAALAKITNAVEVTLGITNNWAGFFPFDAAQPSFSDYVERAPTLAATLVTVHDSVSAGWMVDARAKKTKFIRIESVGPIIGAGPGTYRFRATWPCKFRPVERGERGDIYGATWNVAPIYDSTFGGFLEIEVINEVATL